MVGMAMQSYVIADKSTIAPSDRAVSVVRILSPDKRDEIRLDSFDDVMIPTASRHQITMFSLENDDANDPSVKAAVALARAAVRPNFSYNQLLTEDRRTAARRGVGDVVVHVPKGTVIVREGDRLDGRAVQLIQALQEVPGFARGRCFRSWQ